MGIPSIIELMYLFVFWRIMKEIQSSIWNIPWKWLWGTVHCGICLKKFHVNKTMLSIIYIYWHINDLVTTELVIWHLQAWRKHVTTVLQHKVYLIRNISKTIRNTIWVQWDISSKLQFHKRSMNLYLGLHLNYFHSNALIHESELSLC